ncbi:MAG TPA: DivIVA domain-containing protein [Desulfitobacteriaceae bacterium]|nr:DivIVA domain-containing protein [Desulfitobacteriaceae bacterium]
MQMTPIDIRNKEFLKGLRGYQCAEVDKFLETVSKEFEIYYKENIEQKEKIEKLEAELAHYHKLESTLHQTMVLAQQTAEEVKLAAHHEAGLVLREAEQEKNLKLSDAQLKYEEIQNEIQNLNQKRELIKTQLKSFLTAQLDLAGAVDTFGNIS